MFGYGQFSRTGRYKLSDNEKFLGGNFGPFTPSISGTGAGTTSATPGNGYTYQTFTSSGTLYVDQPITADILIIGGGGAGGGGPAAPGGGGGGGGGIVEITNYSLSAGSYTVVVGSGATNYDSYRGGSSYILTGAGTTLALALGGGVGGSGYYNSTPISVYTYNAAPGGSGGGAVGYSAPVPPSFYNNGAPAAQPGYSQPLIPAPNLAQHGFAGGIASPHGGYGGSSAQGGGGGAGAVGGSSFGAGPGSPSGNVYGGSGGAGKQFLAFKGPDIGVPALGPYNGVYAGGGGAWSTYIYPAVPYRPLGGNGGGGNGGYVFQPPYPPSPTTQINGTDGAANTGGGGGGGSTVPVGPRSGGSGLVVVRYQVSP